MLLAHLTDLHVRPRGLASNRVSETNKFVERAIARVASLRPAVDAVLISGDLTECGLAEEYEHLRKLLRPLAMPVYLVPGNHDRRENLQRFFGDYLGLSSGLQTCTYAVDSHPVRLIALDTAVPGSGHGALDGAQLDWLADTLESGGGRPTIVFLHHPPFLCGIRHMDEIRLLDGAERLAEIIGRHANVERVLCGHHHRVIFRRWAGTIASIGPSVAHQVALDLQPDDEGALVFEPPAFQLHRWSEAEGLVTHVAYVEVFDGPYPFVTDPDYPGK